MQTRKWTISSAEALANIDLRRLPEASVHMVVAGLLGDIHDLQAEVRQLQQELARLAVSEPGSGSVVATTCRS